MLKNHIIELLKKSFLYEPTSCQEELIVRLAEFVVNNDKQMLIIAGYAGTGKTSLIGAFIKALQEVRLRSILMAPTGRAAKILSQYANKTSLTIHKKIYRQKSSKDGFGDFQLDKNLHTATFFIVDEASMIADMSLKGSVFGSGNLLNDMVQYVYNDKNCKLILIGDDAQLPPVGLDYSPALAKQNMERYGMEVLFSSLHQVVRQAEGSGILSNATIIREMIRKNIFEFPKIRINGFTDIVPVSGADLIEEISSAYDRYGIRETIVVSRSNKRANRYNMGIRNQVLWRDSELAVGDLLMVVKNNYFWVNDYEEIDFIANGDIFEIVRILNYEENYGFRFANVVAKLIDFEIEIETKILLDSLMVEAASLPQEDNKKLFYAIMEEYQHLSTKKKQYEAVRSNDYFNALQVKYAYSVTCHKAQGGQWKAVFIDQGYLTADMINIDFLRWLYTAFTRASEKLYLVNFNKEFYVADSY